MCLSKIELSDVSIIACMMTLLSKELKGSDCKTLIAA